MRIKLTLRFLVNMIIVLAIVMIINLFVLMIGASTIINKGGIGEELWNKGITPIDFTRDFAKFIKKDEEDLIDENGKEILEKEKLWIQVLNSEGRETYSYRKPEYIRKKYSPFDIVNAYKYGIDNESDFSIFIGDKEIEDMRYSYVIGFPLEVGKKVVFTYSEKTVGHGVGKMIRVICIGNVIVALFFGWIFSRGLSKPVNKVINGIQSLTDGKYDVNMKAKGIYKGVITNINNLAKTLENNEIEQKRNEKSREEWIANISHDIKTPLASIKGYAEILSGDYEIDKDEAEEYSKIINQKSDHIKGLVDDLNLSLKLKHNKSFLNKEKNDLGKVLRESVIHILNDPEYGDSSIEIEEVIDNTKILIDKRLIRRVFDNFIYNSVTHNDSGVEIRIKLEELEHRIKISIRDNGKGIKDEELEHIFDRYYRGTNTSEKSGSGLGMAIAKDIVAAHDGNVEVISEIGKGTSVEIYLPKDNWQ